MSLLARRPLTVPLLAVTAVSLMLFTPGLPASAHPQHIREITAMMQADRQGPMFTEGLGPIDCENGSAGPFPCQNVDLLSFTPLGELGGATGNDVWGWTDPLTGKEYALMGLGRGISFVDISDPTDPEVLGILPTHTNSSFWRDMKVYGDHMFVVADLAPGHGMQVFDLTQLRNPPPRSGRYEETAHYAGFGSAHNVAVNEETGFAYVVGSNTCAGGLHMIDVTTPTSPTFAGCFSDDGYTHDVQCVVYRGPDATYDGGEICFASNEDTLTIVDVTDKSAPRMLSRTTYPGANYTHQGWLTEDQATFVLNDELDEINLGHNTRTRFFDVSDLENPSLDFFVDLRTPAIDHNLYVVDDHVFEANYRAGLQILEADIAANEADEVGYFDVYPPDDRPDFNGAWGNYPFLGSGVVLISGIEQGLFVVRPDLP